MGVLTGLGYPWARGVHTTIWAGLRNTASVGSWQTLPTHSDKTVEVRGTWGPGATVIIQGTNALVSTLTSGTTGFTLNDSRGTGNPLSFTTGKIVQMLENPTAIRPVVTALTSATTPTLTVRITAESRFR